MNAFRSHVNISTSDSDMTPMVDVTFLLLIFFMVTAAFTMQRSIAIPKSTDAVLPGEPTATPDIVIEVDEFNTFHVKTDGFEQEAPSEHDLVRTLRQARQQDTLGRPLSHLLVKANPDALHEKVVAALDSGAYVGISKIELLTVEGD